MKWFPDIHAIPERKKMLFASALVIGQIILLSIIIFRYQWVIFYGDTYFTQVIPVDPRDMFRGDYVSLTYEKNFLSVPVSDEKKAQVGDSIYLIPKTIPYVSNQKTGQLIEGYSDFQLSKPNSPFIKAKVENIEERYDTRVAFTYSGVSLDLPYSFVANDSIYRSGDTINSQSIGNTVYLTLDTTNEPKIWYATTDKYFSDSQSIEGKISQIVSHNRRYTFTFNADRYFIKEGDGRQYEDAIRNQTGTGVLIEWKVGSNGAPVVSDFLFP